VQKFGGTSVGSVERIRAVARRCLATQRQGNEVVVIVSAMAGETNRLLALAREIHPEPDERECDVIAATGEQVSVGLLALAIQALGGEARSFLGHQVRVLTDSAFARARILEIDGARVVEPSVTPLTAMTTMVNTARTLIARFMLISSLGELNCELSCSQDAFPRLTAY